MSQTGPQITKGEWGVLIFTLLYVGAFTVGFLVQGNYEFVLYVITMVILIGLVGFNARKASFPLPILWALTLWGLAHMAGGGVTVDGAVLYAYMLVPLVGEGELTLLKYDQVVHAYGFGVTAWVLWHLLTHHFPQTIGTATSYVFPAIGAMGLGSVNEIIEFIAVLSVPDTNVGGYFNTAIDLVCNAFGAVVAMILVALFHKRVRPN